MSPAGQAHNAEDADPAAAASRLQALRRWWQAVSARERRLLTLAGALVAVALLWFVALQPAWRTLNKAPAEKARLDAQLTEMRSLAQEAAQLRTAPPLPPEQAAGALKSVTERLGPKAKLSIQGERAIVTLEGLPPPQLGPWLEDLRASARARPVEANLSRTAAGFNGTVVLSLGGQAMTLSWVLAGLLLGAVPAAVAWAPASLMVYAVNKATGGHVLLADAEGTLWKGDAVLALTNGADQLETTALPGRLNWQLGLHQGMPAVWLQQACCVNGQLLLQWRPGLDQQRIAVQGGGLAAGEPGPAAATATAGPQPAQQTTLQPAQQAGTALVASAAPMAPGVGGAPGAGSTGASWGQWPVSVLSGLGTPWNTLRPSGSMQLSSQQLELHLTKGQLVFAGQLELVLSSVASRVSTLDNLGDYRLTLQATPDGGATVQLQTLRGALQLQGNGQWSPAGLRFSGQASAAPGSEAALNNLLNIIGRREGAVSLFSIG